MGPSEVDVSARADEASPKMIDSSMRWNSLLPALTLAVLTAFGVRHGAVVAGPDPYAIYQEPVSPDGRLALGFSLRDESERLGEAARLPVAGPQNAWAVVDDYNGDGRPDLLLLAQGANRRPLLKLLRNDGGRRFVDVTVASRLDLSSGALAGLLGAQFVDLDNNGLPELILSRDRRPLLVMRNERGRFRDAARDFGVDQLRTRARSINAADFDGDGYLDLYLGNYHSMDRAAALVVAVGNHVLSKHGGPNLLLRNIGGKRLVDVTAGSGVENRGHTWSTAVADFDGDGRPDIFVANDFGLDAFFRNLGSMRFEDATRSALGQLRSRFSMASDAGDSDGDGLLDLYVSNVSNPGMARGFGSLWRNRGQGGGRAFEDQAFDRGVDRCGWAWGSKWVDLNRDGRLDLVVVNGLRGRKPDRSWYERAWSAVTPEELKRNSWFARPWNPRAATAPGQRNCVFINEGDRFVDVAEEAGMRDTANGRGLAVLDFDDDGAPDLVVANADAAPFLYRNAPQRMASWIGLRLIGHRSNRAGIGALVRAKTNRRLMVRLVQPGNGFSAQSDRRVLLGWPADEKLLSLEIIWPGGARQAVPHWRMNAYQDINEG